MTKASIFIACPAFKQVNFSQTTETIFALGVELTKCGIDCGFATYSFPNNSAAYGMFLSVWYDVVRSSHILFIDDDMHFEPSVVLDMLEADKPVIGAIYPKRPARNGWVGHPLVEPEQGQTLVECHHVGAGILLVRRDAIDALLSHQPSIADTRLHRFAIGPEIERSGGTRLIRAFDRLEDDEGEHGPDVSFCMRLRQAGVPIFANISHDIGHVGPHEWRGHYGI